MSDDEWCNHLCVYLMSDCFRIANLDVGSDGTAEGRSLRLSTSVQKIFLPGAFTRRYYRYINVVLYYPSIVASLMRVSSRNARLSHLQNIRSSIQRIRSYVKLLKSLPISYNVFNISSSLDTNKS